MTYRPAPVASLSDTDVRALSLVRYVCALVIVAFDASDLSVDAIILSEVRAGAFEVLYWLSSRYRGMANEPKALEAARRMLACERADLPARVVAELARLDRLVARATQEAERAGRRMSMKVYDRRLRASHAFDVALVWDQTVGHIVAREIAPPAYMRARRRAVAHAAVAA